MIKIFLFIYYIYEASQLLSILSAFEKLLNKIKISYSYVVSALLKSSNRTILSEYFFNN